VAVGASWTSTSGRAVLFDGRKVVDLATRLPLGSTWSLAFAQRINDRGQIIGWGTPSGTPCPPGPNAACLNPHAFLLTPSCAAAR
jgi:hypothetical protein